MSLDRDQSGDRSCAPPGKGKGLFRVFLRSFLIQAGWNYERFQNLGFAFSLMPAFRSIHSPGPLLNAAVLRHLAQFNTQPYMAGFVMGNIIRMEEDLSGRPAEAAEERRMMGVKSALASGFAAIGDRVFWGRLKPLTTQLCILIWLLAGFYCWLLTGGPSTPGCRPSIAVLLGGPLAGMAVYGAFAVYLRWKGLKSGYACGGSAACGLDALNWPRLIKGLSVAGFALSSLIVAAAFFLLISRISAGELYAGLLWKAVPVLAVIALQRFARKAGRSIFFTTGVILAASLVLTGLVGTAPR